MHLSSQEEYGLRCLLEVARHLDDHDTPALVSIQDIARAEALSPEYVAKLMRVLRNGGLVTSTRGANGGYRLIRHPSRITLWDAIGVLGSGPLFSESFCNSHPGLRSDCVHSGDCSIRPVWRQISGLLRTALSAVTLDDLRKGELATLMTFAQGSSAGLSSARVRATEATDDKSMHRETL
jgi:Rrf2 family protein